ncbi:chitobiase/beta-hexosaminidase C-terminal domain-containing protein [Paenibacillus sp. YN15]|uniref:chitobiase/beta-hexosaminidase C-terminal domain-containing protein n=1 Tax=Paenibacillus sp. YN15 TaxID=1742774 RepID=UPI001C661D85|nr:chitobiase/beta-hexosaminidase C-terminal domain-containing protein [Paenibacillus sp. YN15]
MTGKSLKKNGYRNSSGLLALLLALQVLVLPAPTARAAIGGYTVAINSSEIVQENFLGVGVNLIPVSFMEGTSQFGYSEAHWEMDRKRIAMMQPKIARVWFQLDWMEQQKGVYDWNSSKMQSFYKYLDTLQAAGTEVEFNFGWKVGADTQSWFSFSEVSDKRISAPRDLDAFADAASAVLDQLINVKGYANIKYLTFYNEPNGNWDFEAPGDQNAYYAQMVRKISDQLTADNLRDQVEIWGPEESGSPAWTQYMHDHAADYFDAYTFHVYGQSYDGLTASIADRMNVTDGKPVIMTEFGFAEDKSKWEAGLAGSVIKAANHGIKGALIWQLNGVWLPDPYVGSDTNGNYTMWDSLVLGTKPYKRYYEASLLTRYIPANSTVVTSNTDSEDLRSAVFKTADGEYTILLEAKAGTDKEVTFDFGGEPPVGKTFYKHVYQADVQLEGNAVIPSASGSFSTGAGSSFTDSDIDAEHNVIVYTTLPPQTQVEVTPLEPVVTAGQAQQLAASVIDNTGGVTWSVIGSGNGAVTAEGLYTAPAVDEEKLVAVKASSVQDPDSYGIALIRVQPAPAAGRADIPQFSLEYGKYAFTEALTITTATEGAEIRYTTDGSAPTLSSTLYTGPIFLTTGTKKITAAAFKGGLEPSANVFRLYKIGNVSAGPDGYDFLAYDGAEELSFTGTASIAYGADGLFFYKTLTGPVSTAGLFEDPNPASDDKRYYISTLIQDEEPAVTIYNAGFEMPVTSAYLTGPITNGWAFDYRSGVQKNGSAFAAAVAPQGTQTAFMISRSGITGELIQDINFREGEYELSFRMASRPSYGDILPFQVYFDDQLLGTYQPNPSGSFALVTTEGFTASAGYHTLRFSGIETPQESTVFIDDVRIRPKGSPPLPENPQPNPLPEEPELGPPLEELSNEGFEAPVLAAHRKGPFTESWYFNGYAGVHPNGSAFQPPPAPEGNQTAFLQSVSGGQGLIRQHLEFKEGTYNLTFQAAKRSTSGGRDHSFKVFVDDTQIGSFTTASTAFQPFVTESFTVSAGAHTIRFVGAAATQEATSFIDDVNLNRLDASE